MNTGDLRHLATLDTPDGDTGTYTPLVPPTWHCALRSTSATQATMSGRFHPGIDTATRVHVQGKTYHVDTVINRDGRDQELVLFCIEVFE